MTIRTITNRLLLSGFLHTFAATFLTNMLAFGSILVVAYFLGPTDIADIRLMQSYTIIGTTLASLGYTTGLLKVCAEANDTYNEQKYLKRVCLHTFWASLAYIAGLLILTHLGVIVLSSNNLHRYLPIMLMAVPLAVIIENFRNYLLAKKAFKLVANAQINVRLLTFFMVIAATYLFGLIGFVIATVLAYLAGVVRFARETGFVFLGLPTVPFPPYFVRFSLFAMLGNLFVIISSYGDMFILDVLIANRALVGAYALSSVLLSGIMVVTVSIQTILMPDIIRNQDDRKWLRQHFIEQQLKLTGLSLVLAVLASVGVALVFPLIYGENYPQTPALFAGLCVNYIFVSSGTLGGSVLMGQGRTSVNTMVAGFALLAGFTAAYVSIPSHGIWGMIYGKALYGLLICVPTNIMVLRSLRENE